MKEWYCCKAAEVLQELGTTAGGLDGAEARERRARYGENRLRESGRKPAWKVFLGQFQDLLVMILIGAAVISMLTDNAESAAVIFAVLLLNAVLGTVQHEKAEKSLESLRALSAPSARVLRDGKRQEIPSAEVVPGDILYLEAGDMVVADGRILESTSLRINESSLTGESGAVEKSALPLRREAALAERSNMVYSGSLVTAGVGTVVVTATGMNTEIGAIAAMMDRTQEKKTPLQISLDQFSSRLAAAIMAVCVVVFLLSIYRKMPVLDSLLFAVALAVAAIPEALGSIVTIVQAMGTQKMAKEQAIIKDLKAVESLGCVSVICTDKTGTLTQNRMTVECAALGGEILPAAELRPADPFRQFFLEACVLANNAELSGKGGAEPAGGIGDATELALLELAQSHGLSVQGIRSRFPRLREYPFDSDRKRMSTVHQSGRERILFCKGAADVLLERCAYIAALPGAEANRRQTRNFTYAHDARDGAHESGKGEGTLGRFSGRGAGDRAAGSDPGERQHFSPAQKLSRGGDWNMREVRPLTPADRRFLAEQNDRCSRQGLRVLGLAYRILDEDAAAAPRGESAAENVERNLVFLGMAAMMDPPRPESAQAVEDARRAGILPIMITGDHKVTAEAVARQVGILERRDVSPVAAVSGGELDGWTDGELDRRLEDIRVYARVTPEHKLRIVRAWQRRGHIVAMTGDGVNDAPALKQADIGIAMGKNGTEVSKDAADMILADDHFATIMKAVANGRNVYRNILGAIQFLLSGNMAGILCVLYTTLLALPLPFAPVHLLFINLLTDSLPAIAIGMEQPERGLLEQPPRDPKRGILTPRFVRDLLVQGGLIAVCTLCAYYTGLSGRVPGGGLSRFWADFTDGGMSLLRESGGFLRVIIEGGGGWNGHAGAASTMAFATLTLARLFHGFNCRSRRSLLRLGIFSNPYTVLAFAAGAALLAAVLFVPGLQIVFAAADLSREQLACVFFFAFFPTLAIQCWKMGREALRYGKRALRKKRGSAA